jgi:hypothetical protein
VLVTTGIEDGDTKIILIALSSGTGESTFFPDIKTPTMIDTNTSKPIMTVMAASVRLRSSIHQVYHFISSFFHAAKLQVG